MSPHTVRQEIYKLAKFDAKTPLLWAFGQGPTRANSYLQTDALIGYMLALCTGWAEFRPIEATAKGSWRLG